MKKYSKQQAGFSLIELLTAMVVTLILLSMVSIILTSAFGTRRRESQRADAMTSAKAALNLMSREISNAGYGLTSNGIVTADSNNRKLRFRTNVENTDSTTNSLNEDITYFYDAANESVVRFDPRGTPQTSVIVNGVSEVSFDYFDYTNGNPNPTQNTSPSENTGRIRINVVVRLENIDGQVDGQTISYTSEVTLRNSNYMLKLY